MSKDEKKSVNLPNADIAALFIEKFDRPMVYEEVTNIYWVWVDGVWEMVSEKRMKYARKERDGFNGIRRFLMYNRVGGMGLTDARFKDIYSQLKGESDYVDILKPKFIAFTDCVLEPKTGKTFPHDPGRTAVVKVNCQYSGLADAEGSNFDSYLDSVCVDDERNPDPLMRDQLQEMAGYLLLPETKAAMSFFLSGKGRNGKGVFLNILRAMLGRSRTTALSLSDMTSSRFAAAGLLGVTANFADETRTTREATSDMFKKLVANDVITADVKFGESVTFRPNAKYFYNVNGVPSFDGFDYAMKERILPVRFPRSFDRHERRLDLTDLIIESEIPYVVRWALDGLNRLKGNNMAFTMTESSKDLLRDFEENSSSVAEWFYAKCEIPDGAYRDMQFTEFSVLYLDYVAFAKEAGRPAKKRKGFSIELADICGPTGEKKIAGRTTTVANCCLKDRDAGPGKK